MTATPTSSSQKPVADMVEFLARWNTLPPLVRASMAVGLLEHVRRWSSDWSLKAHYLRDVGLDRRAYVTERFVESSDVLIALLLRLTIDADAEAVARAIDADILAHALVHGPAEVANAAPGAKDDCSANLSFSLALEALEKGMFARRAAWLTDGWLIMHNGSILRRSTNDTFDDLLYDPCQSDLLACDWEVTSSTTA